MQCQMAGHAYERLSEQARCEIQRDFSSRKPRPLNTVELLADCTVFLSAAAVIAKILFSGADPKNGKALTSKSLKTSAIRCERLRGLLGFQNLPTLRSLGVRNAFEHIDERLDRLLTQNTPVKLVQYHLTRHPPPDGLVLKRFDPQNISISYLDERLDLQACFSEIKLVEAGVAKAHDRIRESGGLLGEGR